jgi:hypothetical protein
MDFAAIGEKRGGGGEGALPRPHDLPGCHPHPATSTSPPPSRPRASPLASWTPRSLPPLNRQRGVGGSSRLCSNTYRVAFAIHAVGHHIAAKAAMRNHLATPRSTVIASANLTPSSGPLGRDLTACAARRGRGKLLRPPRPPRRSTSPPTVSTVCARNHHRRI